MRGQRSHECGLRFVHRHVRSEFAPNDLSQEQNDECVRVHLTATDPKLPYKRALCCQALRSEQNVWVQKISANCLDLWSR